MTNKFLKNALFVNFLFSLSSAIIIFANNDFLSPLFGFSNTIYVNLIAAALILFSVLISYQILLPRTNALFALLTTISDFLWVIFTTIALLIYTSQLNLFAHLIVIAINIFVFSFGIFQLIGLYKMFYSGRDGFFRHCIQVEVNVSKELMWNIIGDIGAIKKYMPSLASSAIINDLPPSIGAIRHCVDINGKAWSEECIDFKDNQSFDVRFKTEAKDFPFPASQMYGGWEVEGGNNISIVKVWWEIKPKPKWMSLIIISLLSSNADKDFPKIIHNMANQSFSTSNFKEEKLKSAPRIITKLIPNLC